MNYYQFLTVCLELYDVNLKRYIAYARFIFGGVPGNSPKSRSLEWLKLRNSKEPTGFWTLRGMAYA